MNDLASSDKDSGISGWILNMPTYNTQFNTVTLNNHGLESSEIKTHVLFPFVFLTKDFGYISSLCPCAYFKHGCLWFSQLMEGGFSCSHFYDGATEGPYVSWSPVPSRALINDFWSHILQSTCRQRDRW